VLASKFRHEAVSGVNENKRGPNMAIVGYKVEEYTYKSTLSY
jgi:hypothetical protein